MRILLKKSGIMAVVAWLTVCGSQIFAADHGDAPSVGNDVATDIGDVYVFLDPNDNTQVVMAFDVHGFIVPGENVNFGAFDPLVLFKFNIENTGDAAPDLSIKVKFSPVTSRTQPQTATITFKNVGSTDIISRFTAPTTVPSTAAVAPTQVVTPDAATGTLFFAGLVDDPFFFDIPGFGRFVASVLAGTPDPTQLLRGRDSFAGYNIQMIALSVPVELLQGPAGTVIGVSATTLRHNTVTYLNNSNPVGSGPRKRIDRTGVPAVNTALIPFARKDEYNRATTQDDAAGVFAADIVNTLAALGTQPPQITALAQVAVTGGDQLRLDTSVINTGLQGGTLADAGFPNGRRPTDDVIDTILFLVTNGVVTTGDSVNGNDLPFQNSFPFFALSQQPRAPGTIDDNTRN